MRRVIVSDIASEYRRKAEECRTKAARETDMNTKVTLSEIAKCWDQLALAVEKNA
jgi:hypothetical protein